MVQCVKTLVMAVVAALMAAPMLAVMGAYPCAGQTAGGQTAAAPPAAAPERIGDWEFVCPAASADGKPDGKPGKRSCRLVQNHAGTGGGTVLLITIVQDTAKIPVAVVSVPEGVYLAPGIELTVDQGQSFKLLYETCNPSGCHAGFKIEGDIAAALKKGQIASHKVFDSKQQPVTIPVSLKGLTKALERLQQEAAP